MSSFDNVWKVQISLCRAVAPFSAKFAEPRVIFLSLTCCPHSASLTLCRLFCPHPVSPLFTLALPPGTPIPLTPLSSAQLFLIVIRTLCSKALFCIPKTYVGSQLKENGFDYFSSIEISFVRLLWKEIVISNKMFSFLMLKNNIHSETGI